MRSRRRLPLGREPRALVLPLGELEQRVRRPLEHRRAPAAPLRLADDLVDRDLDPVERAERVVVVALCKPRLVCGLLGLVEVAPLGLRARGGRS